MTPAPSARAGGAPAARQYVEWRDWDECLRVGAGAVHWLERERAGGRLALHRRAIGGRDAEQVAGTADVASEVQGYGGGAYCLAGGDIVFVDGADRQLHLVGPDRLRRPLTRAGAHGDLSYDATRRAVVCLREVAAEEGAGTWTQVVQVATTHAPDATARVLLSDAGFIASPRVSPCGRYLACVRWDFPAMPWDVTRIEVHRLQPDGAIETCVAALGDGASSLAEPRWAADGTLYFLDDRSGWWNPRRWHPATGVEDVLQVALEFGHPPYRVGLQTYALAPGAGAGRGQMLAATWRRGRSVLLLVDLDSGTTRELPSPFEDFRGLQFAQGAFWLVGVRSDTPGRIIRIDPQGRGGAETDDPRHAPPWIVPPPRTFAWREPRSRELVHAHLHVPVGEVPPSGWPLVVYVHGGPTGAATRAFDAVAQFWVRSGFAHLAVNHRGSTGFGRAARRALEGAWGVAEVEDCLLATRQVAGSVPIDPRRRFVRGNSAGGFTALLCAMGETPFAAAACHYGVTDLERLCEQTHKFESRYLDSLVGPLASQRARYRERSPLRRSAEISVPVIFFQGLSDRIVDPGQTRSMAQALRERGLACEFHAFAGEGHGFRRDENLADALERERDFFHRAGRAASRIDHASPHLTRLHD